MQRFSEEGITIIEISTYYVTIAIDIKHMMAANIPPEEVFYALNGKKTRIKGLEQIKNSIVRDYLKCHSDEVDLHLMGFTDTGEMVFAYVNTSGLVKNFTKNELRSRKINGKEYNIVSIKAPFDDLVQFADAVKNWDLGPSRYLVDDKAEYIEMAVDNPLTACSVIFRLVDYGDYTRYIPEQSKVVIAKDAIKILADFAG